MNDLILQALMRLFALVAFVNEKGQAGREREVIHEYLRRQFESALVEKYLYAFDKYLIEYHPDLSASIDKQEKQSSENIKAVVDVCNQLNEEFEQEQKIYILVYLLDFISSGSQCSSYQFQFIDIVADNLHIPDSEYHDAKYFTFDEIDKIQNPDNLLFIDSNTPPNNKMIKHLFIDKMDDRIHVLHLPITNTLIFRYQGNEVFLLNGHSLKSGRSYIWAQGSVIKNHKLGSIYYIWVAAKFIKQTEESQFVFTADEIEFSYGNSPNGIKRFNLNEESGRLIGIIGGSGSGKSTLLKVLAGVIKPNNGSIKINGFDIHEQSFDLKGIVGYVPQDEFLIKELTVFENLYYTAKFTFSKYSEEDISKLVKNALVDFDLVEASDLQVGNSLNTFLSGGQRKRLNIALELLREPSVLFVDEPSSGLSSMDTEKVMNLLKRQTFKGKLVFANIHQPSSDIFKLLDKLLVVDQGGRVIWYGNPVDAISYLKHANHYVDADSIECLNCGNINTEQVLRNVEARVVDVNGRLTRNRKTSPEEWYEQYMNRIDPIIKNISRKHPHKVPKSNFSAPSRWEQIKLYFKRDLLTKLKNQQYILITLAEAPVLALLLAFYTRSSRDAIGNITNYSFGSNNNLPAFIFMAVIVALFLGLILSAEEIFKDRKLLERERFLNLSRSSYLLSKTLVLFMISAIQMVIFVLISNYVLEIKDMNWRYFIVLFTTASWANMVGLNISSGFKSVVTIYILVPLILVPQLLFSGVVVDFNNLNGSSQSFKHVPLIGDAMTSRWSYEALITTQFRDNKFQKHFYDSEQKMSEALYTKAYLIPKLLEKLKFIDANIEDRKMFSELTANFSLLQNEIKKICILTGQEQTELISQLKIDTYSETSFQEIEGFLLLLKSNYHAGYLKAMKEHDNIYNSFVNKLGSSDKFIEFKNTYSNNQLGNLVRNDKELMQFFTHRNNIIKLKDPIFTLPVEKNGRAHYYAPVKRVRDFYIDTFWFNIIVIWATTVLMFIVLYFDILFNVIKYFENIRLRRFNRRIVKILHR